MIHSVQYFVQCLACNLRPLLPELQMEQVHYVEFEWCVVHSRHDDGGKYGTEYQHYGEDEYVPRKWQIL